MGNKFEWVVHSTTATNIDSGAGDSYDLVNVTITKCLRYGEREYGINLLWDEPGRTSPNIGFERNGAAQAIQYGELIAIHVEVVAISGTRNGSTASTWCGPRIRYTSGGSKVTVEPPGKFRPRLPWPYSIQPTATTSSTTRVATAST